jgi:hypothetical protein
VKANRSNLRDVCMLSHQKCRLTRSTRAPRQALKWKARTVVLVRTDGKYLLTVQGSDWVILIQATASLRAGA